MAGAFHGVGEAERVINVGVSGPGVVYHALQSVKGQPLDVVAETVKKTAFQVTRMGQLVAKEASSRLDTPFGIVDLSPGSYPGYWRLRGPHPGGNGPGGLRHPRHHRCTGPVERCCEEGRRHGVLLRGRPVRRLYPRQRGRGHDRRRQGGARCAVDKLEAMTCVCSVGLDMIAVPGDTSAETISAIIADEAAIGMVNNKTTAVRLLPTPGKNVGDTVEMGGLLGSAPVMPVHKESSADFIQRGGRIPAPLHSLRN